jgi:peptidylprolyl isomerase
VLRLLAAPSAAVLAVLALAGCAITPPTLETPAPTAAAEVCASTGPASEAVSVSGALGASPVVAAEGPFSVDRVERTVLLEGAGDTAAQGDLVEVTITMLNATSGDQGPGTANARVLLQEAAALPGLLATIRCTPAGSRVVGVVPSEDAYGTAGQPELAIGPGDDVVFVVDVLAILPLQAAGTPSELPADFPELRLRFAPDGRPTVGIPDVDPPATLQSAVVLEGEGPVVAAGDEILLQLQAVNWRTGEVFDETWGDSPRSLLTVLPGVDASILGRTVGSRVVIVVPPADGFGSTGSPSSGVSGTDTVVYVVDILATTSAPA